MVAQNADTDTTNLQGYDPDISPADAKLIARGILQPAREMNWRFCGNGWEYPVHDTTGQLIGERFKNINSAADLKYCWLNDTNADYYHIGEGFIDAIREAGGVVYQATGEPALLAHLAAGMRNVVCFFGEKRQPATYAADLKAWGVTTVIYCPDKDTSGIEAAAKNRDALLPTDIYFDCRTLPDELPHGADTNDLWQLARFDSTAFMRQLDSLPPAVLREPEPQPDAPNFTHTYEGDLPAALVQDIVKALLQGRKQPRIRKGEWYGAVQCPIGKHDHDAQRPAAYWNTKTNSLTCHKCEKTYNAHTTAKALGLDVHSYYLAYTRPQFSTRAAESPQTNPTLEPAHYFDVGLPDTWTAAANKVGINVSALHLIYTSAAARQSHLLSITDLQTDNLAHGYAIEPRRLYETIQLLDGHIVRILPEESLGLPGKKRTNTTTFEILPYATAKQYLLTCLATRLNEEYHPAEGERAVVAVPTARMLMDADAPAESAAEVSAIAEWLFDDLAEELFDADRRCDAELRYWEQALDDHTHTPLPPDMPKHNSSTLTRALAVVKVPTGVMIRQFEIARTLGTSVRTVRTILKQTGFKGNLPNIKPQQVGSIIEAKKFARTHHAKIMQFVSYTPNQSPTRHYYRNSEEANAFIQAETSRGACVFAEIKPPLIYERVVQVVEPEVPAEPREKVSPPREAPREKVEAEPAPTFAPHQYDPAWVCAQLRLLLKLLQPERWHWNGESLMHINEYGECQETYIAPTANTLIALILNRPVYTRFVHHRVAMPDGHIYKQVWPPLETVAS